VGGEWQESFSIMQSVEAGFLKTEKSKYVRFLVIVMSRKLKVLISSSEVNFKFGGIL
jgi:hypothetical protein